ncbi:RNA 3'-terminal phosphate cyclase [Athelia psychrophila]|uniref:RNA 3'-terminal-phosphate cyclase (ATP) n=1 Tax=Athelia psychrophila TaxID=1759441 RepID=A0A166SWJ1_9AGAM|nr:RNA 3'-terminal phosphate cyclase [Fibularhizoctonia sp. CBS 109695]
MSAILARTLIDGSVLEGGGQLLRNSVALSALLGKPISVDKIRNGRKPPGLRRQHEAGIKLVAEISSAALSGVSVKSTALDFTPGPILTGKSYIADPGTAGSTTLLLQVSLPCLIFSRSTTLSTLTLRGGTNASLAPQIDYTQHLLLPFLRAHFGIPSELALLVKKRGYFPRGGGEVCCSIPPIGGPLPAMTLVVRGEVIAIRGEARVGGLPAHLAQAMVEGAKAEMVCAGYGSVPIEIAVVREKNEAVIGSGGGVVLWAETSTGCRIGGTAVSEKKREASEVGLEAARELATNLAHGGCVDEYLQDQIIIFMALAQGTSTVRTGPVTLHTKTAIWVAELLTDAKFEIQDNTDGSMTITCRGIGYTAPLMPTAPSDTAEC